MALIQRFIDKIRGKRAAKQAAPPLIMTPWGAVSESARLQAAQNMAADHEKRAKVIGILADQFFGGDIVAGEREARRRYPEAFVGDDEL